MPFVDAAEEHATIMAKFQAMKDAALRQAPSEVVTPPTTQAFTQVEFLGLGAGGAEFLRLDARGSYGGLREINIDPSLPES